MLEYIGVGLLFIVILIVFCVYCGLQKDRDNVKETRSKLTIFLYEKWSLIPVIIEIVKRYNIYDNSIIEKLSKIGNENYDSLSLEKKIEIDRKTSKVISKMIEIGDEFEKLNKSEDYLNFKKNFENIEKEIKENKKMYRRHSKKYNSKVQKFPINLVAILFGFNEEIIK